MARTNPMDHAKHLAMFQRRLRPRLDPFPEGRPAVLDDLTFLPANLSRLVIDPYREACQVSTDIAARYELAQPFFVTGFDRVPDEVREAVAAGLKVVECGYVGTSAISESVPWFQLVIPTGIKPSKDAAGLIFVGDEFESVEMKRLFPEQLIGLAVSSPASLERVIVYALEQKFDMLLLDGTGNLDGEWPELAGAPDLRLIRDAIVILRRLKQEEAIDLVYFGGVRSGTDAAKLIALGAKAVVLGVSVALALGGEIVDGNTLQFASDYTDLDRSQATANIIKASSGEASMMARCTGKTNLQNLEPEDLRSITLATAQATGIPLVGLH